LHFFLSGFAQSIFFSPWNKAFHAVHAITNGILSLFLLHFLLGVFGHCKLLEGKKCVYH
jgi:hypothetical protein